MLGRVCAALVTSQQLEPSIIVETKQTGILVIMLNYFLVLCLASLQQVYSFDAHLYNIEI